MNRRPDLGTLSRRLLARKAGALGAFRGRPGAGLVLAGLLFAAALPLGVAAQTATPAAGQPAGIKVVIDRPGEGETYYTGLVGPRTTVPIVGHVTGSDFDPAQLEVQFEVLQDGKPVGRETGTPEADGRFFFRALTNAYGTAELGSPEGNCFRCHGHEPVEIPRGEALVRVTAIEPTGRKASAERRIYLDQAGTATVTVQVGIADQPGRTVSGLLVDATTRVYDWRARKFTALTDGQGRATLRLEALSRAATRYRINVAPIQIDGVRYQAAAPVEIDLPPGAASAGPVNLAVVAHLGQISGTVVRDGGPPAGTIDVRAVQLPYGRAFTGSAAGGRFTLDGLPMGDYLLAVDGDQAAALNAQPAVQRIALDDRQFDAGTLGLVPATGGTVRGTLRAGTGAALPFGWVSAGGDTISPATPLSGEFAVYGLPSGRRTLGVSAPGYWSRVVPAWPGATLDVRLEAKPGTRTIPWGAGSLVVPEGTLATGSGPQIRLQRGWLWGRGDTPLTVITSDAALSISGGAFAIEYLPGESAWLYLVAGEASIGSASGGDVNVKAGEMCAFAGRGIARPLPVPLDGAAIRMMGAQRALPVLYEPQPGVWPRVQELAASVGVMDFSPLAAILSLLTFGLCATGAVVVARRRRQPPRSREEPDGDGDGDEPTGAATGGEDGAE